MNAHMTPQRLREIKVRITKNQSVPDLPDLAFELIAALEKRHELDRVQTEVRDAPQATAPVQTLPPQGGST